MSTHNESGSSTPFYAQAPGPRQPGAPTPGSVGGWGVPSSGPQSIISPGPFVPNLGNSAGGWSGTSQQARRPSISPEQFQYALKALVRTETAWPALGIGAAADSHPLPAALVEEGQVNQAFVFDGIFQCWRSHGTLQDFDRLRLTLREVQGETDAYRVCDLDDVSRQVRSLFEGESPAQGAGMDALLGTLRFYLIDRPRALAYEGWWSDGGSVPTGEEARWLEVGERLDRFRQHGNEPEGPLTDDQLSALIEGETELVSGVLVARQPAIIGGPTKSLKTQVSLDMALSLATGTCWLGHEPWAVPTPRRVLFCSGESGGRVLFSKRRVMERVRCLSMGRDQRREFDEAVRTNFFWEPRRQFLPDLSSAQSLVRWQTQVQRARIEVVFLDPLLLCLGRAGQDLTNAAVTGRVVMSAFDAVLGAGATLVLVHHSAGDRARRNSEHAHEPLELTDLAYPGVTNFVRQWVTVNRAEPYAEEERRSALWLGIGGSGLQAGGVFRAVITEGHDHGRWDCRVTSRAGYAQERVREREAQAARESLDRNRRVLGFIQQNAGTTRNAMVRDTESLSRIGASAVDAALRELQERGSIRVEERGGGQYIYPVNEPQAPSIEGGGAGGSPLPDLMSQARSRQGRSRTGGRADRRDPR